MRKLLPYIFFLATIIGAGAIGYFYAKMGQSELAHQLSQTKQQAAVELAEKDKTSNELRAEVKALKSDNQNLMEKQQTLTTEYEIQTEKLQKQLVEQTGSLSAELENLQRQLDTTASQLASVTDTSEELTNSNDELQQKLNSTKEEHKLELAEIETNLRETLTAEITANSAQTTSDQELEYQTNLDLLEGRLSELDAEATSLKEQLAANSTDHALKIADIEKQYQSKLSEESVEQVEKLKAVQNERDFLFTELDRYANTTNAMFQSLGKDVGGLDILLTPEFKSNYAEFLNEVNLGTD